MQNKKASMKESPSTSSDEPSFLYLLLSKGLGSCSIFRFVVTGDLVIIEKPPLSAFTMIPFVHFYSGTFVPI